MMTVGRHMPTKPIATSFGIASAGDAGGQQPASAIPAMK
jgi:hypothetical protein